jgi:hypothetical protein
MTCNNNTKCPIDELPVSSGTYKKTIESTNEFNTKIELALGGVIKKIIKSDVKSTFGKSFEDINKEVIDGKIKLDSFYVQKYNGYVASICINYKMYNEKKLSSSSIRLIDSFIVVQLKEFYDFVKNYEAGREQISINSEHAELDLNSHDPSEFRQDEIKYNDVTIKFPKGVIYPGVSISPNNYTNLVTNAKTVVVSLPLGIDFEILLSYKGQDYIAVINAKDKLVSGMKFSLHE